MKVLAVETSTDFLDVAIVDEGQSLASIKAFRRQGHSAYLVPMIEQALKIAECALNDVYGFAISIGPGSFTGLRVGLATVKGLSFATGKPAIDIPTLDVLADNLSLIEQKIICPIIDAKKEKLYTALYEYKRGRQKRLTSYKLTIIDTLIQTLLKKGKDVIFLGDGLSLYQDKLKSRLKHSASFAPERFWSPSSTVVARMAEALFKQGIKKDPRQILPMYLYSRECSIKGR